MVYYYTSQPAAEVAAYTIYVAKDAAENDALLEFAFPNDLWLKAEGAKSAQVFLRAPAGSAAEAPDAVLEDCAQLVRDSLGPKKRDSFKVVYTLCSNIKGKAAGRKNKDEIAFVDSSAVHTRPVRAQRADALQRLQATRKERFPDLEQERLAHDAEERRRNTDQFRQSQKQTQDLSRQYRALAEAKDRGYSDLFGAEAMEQSSNQNRAEDWEDDFM